VERFIREGTYLTNHTKEVLAGLRLGFILFIVSEVCFSSHSFGLFSQQLSPNIEMEVNGHHLHLK